MPSQQPITEEPMSLESYQANRWRTIARLSWVVWGVSMILTALGSVLLALSYTTPAVRWGPRGFLIFIAIPYATIGALIVSRRPRNLIGWLFCWVGLQAGVQVFFEQYSIYTLLTKPGSLPGGEVTAWIDGWVWVLGAVPGTTLLFLLFPQGRLLSPRWRPSVWLVGICMIGLIFAIAFLPGRFAYFPSFENPFGIKGAEAILQVVFGVAMFVWLILALASAASLIVRWRSSRGEERQQLKWFTYAAALTALGTGVNNSGLPLPAGSLLMIVPLIGLPIATGIAILHYRLYDIDIIINRTLVYGGLTILLVALFGGSLFIISRVFQAFTSGQQSVVALVVAALFFGLLFQPTRLRLQQFVDRRFYGIQIDYQPVRLKQPFPAIARPTAATQFGTYKNLELIGRGGMAEVYKAHHPTLNRPVAIKILPAQLATEADFRNRFVREAQTIATLKHPNIVQVFDFGEVENTYYMVMEHIAGPDLGDFLRSNGPLSLDQAKPIIQDIASALDYSHAENLVHRDIKPSNVMLEPITAPDVDGQQHPQRAVLMDFGIAKIVGSATRFTQTGGVLGTFDYIAPEQIEASGDIDGRADVYALGIMVYQMLTGELPFQHHNPGALLIAHMTRPAPDPRDVVPDLSREAAQALQRALAKNPTDRYNTAGEFVKALI